MLKMPSFSRMLIWLLTKAEPTIAKVKSCYNPLRLGTVIVLVSSGFDFVNTPHLYSDRAARWERLPIWPYGLCQREPKVSNIKLIQDIFIYYNMLQFISLNMCQSLVIGPDSLYCGKWRKFWNAYRDLDLDCIIPNVELIRAIIKWTLCCCFSKKCNYNEVTL